MTQPTIARVLIALICGCSLLSTSTFAQAPDSVQQQIDNTLSREAERQRAAEEALNTDVDVFYPPAQPLPEAPAVDDARCVAIDRIDLHGAERMPESARARVLSPFVGACLSVAQLNNVIAAVTNWYLDRGDITTRAYLGPQDINDRQLDVEVIEGRIESLRLDGTKARRELATAFPGLTGAVLNLRDLEQGIEQMNRLPSNDARLDLVPGAEQGTTTVVVRNQPKRRLRARLSADNHGSDSTGKAQLGGVLQFDNPGGLNDQLTLQFNGTGEQRRGRRARGWGFGYAVPYGAWSFDLGANVHEYRQTIVGLNETFSASGDSTAMYGAVSRLLRRGQSNKTDATFRLTSRDNANFLEDVRLATSSQTLTVGALSLRHLERFAWGQFSITGGYQRGLPWLGADDTRPDRDAPQTEFDSVTLDLNVQRAFRTRIPLTISSHLHGQTSSDVLFGSQQIVIGSAYSVRGFEGESLSGRRGGYWRNEVAAAFNAGFGGKAFSMLSPYLALDLGAISSNARTTGGRLAGAALGVRTQGGPLALDLYLAAPLDQPDTFGRRETVVSARVAYTF